MNDTVLTVIISAGAGVVGGGITALVAPWVQWNIKKREKQYETRQKFLEEWRQMVKDLAHKPRETPEGNNWEG
jgi:3-hydroxyacyl-CoA dehydrogenase